MAGVLSVRVTSAERKRLLQLKVERGCNNVSDLIRLMLGFPRSPGMEIIDGADDIDSVSALVKTVLILIDRVEMNNAVTYELAQQAGLRQVRHRPIEDLIAPRDEPVATRNGSKHPALPEGFAR